MGKMKGSFILFLLINILAINGNSQQKDTANYFEGYVEFKTEFKSLMPEVSDNELRDRIGHTLKIYYKEEYVKWIFSDDLGYIKSYLIMNGKESIRYDWSDDSPDTIYTYNLRDGKRTILDSMKNDGNQIVLGCNCETGKFFASNFYEGYNIPIPTVYKYSFCPAYRLNPEWTKNNNSMSWNKIVEKYKSIMLKIESYFEHSFSANFTATKVIIAKNDPSIFVIDKTKIIKPTFID